MGDKNLPIVKHYSNFDDYIVIKMELLEDLPNNINGEEFERIRDILWNDPEDIDKIESSDPEIQKMVDSIISARNYLGHIDTGLHNLMYDPKTNEYKQIDIF